MKLVISVVVLMCVGAAQAQGTITLTLDILSEIQKIKTIEERLNALELKSKNEEKMKVAFSASPSDIGYIGPQDEAKTLVYENVFTNIGNAYDSTTGIFTAPVKGVYFFNFVVFNAAAPESGVKLLKNDKLVVAATDSPPLELTEDTACNSVTLLLEQGDQIRLQLIEKRRIYTDNLNRNTFSGHLLFTVLLKNSRSVLSATDNAPRWDDEDTTCYSISLLLEQGDRIHLQLMENHQIYTDIFNQNTFSGRLLCERLGPIA